MGETQSKDEGPVLGTRAVAWVAGLSLCWLAGLLFLVPPVLAMFGAYLFFTMTLITLTDLRHFIIPDVLSLPALPLGLLASAVVHPDGDWLAGATNGLIGAFIGGGAFYLLRAAYFMVRRIEGLGLGDVKLAAVAGAWLGPAALAPACLAATLSAIAGLLLHAAISGRRTLDPRRTVPFGSFIAPTIMVFWLLRILSPAPLW
jgi:leader peptidase (prepilin peptidase) / N-methyltransferase